MLLIYFVLYNCQVYFVRIGSFLDLNIELLINCSTNTQQFGAPELVLEQSWFSLVMFCMFTAASTGGKVVFRSCSKIVSTVLAFFASQSNLFACWEGFIRPKLVLLQPNRKNQYPFQTDQVCLSKKL